MPLESSSPRNAPFLTLLLPVVVVASLVGLHALAEGVSVSNPALPPIDAGTSVTQAAVEDAGAPVAEADDAAPDDGQDDASGDDDAAEFDGHIPSIAELAPYPEAEDVLAHAHPGPDGRLWSKRDGKPVPLTLDVRLQQKVAQLLRSYNPPYAAVAAIEPSTGRVLALVQSSRDANARELGLRAVYPAASVFKVVTAAALLEKGVDPNREVCFHGGKHRIQKKLLEDSSRDGTCYDMGTAMAKSANVVFAKLARDHLTPEQLRTEAGKWGFNRELAFDQPLEKSPANIPETPFEFATTAAGFGQVFLSPLHGALLAAAVGNGGVMPTPTLFEGEAAPGRRVLEAGVASTLADMMERTVSGGTARKAFRERGREVMKGISVAGKTGSLDDKKPFHDYTWFVGFTPRENPRIAVAVVVVNDLIWRVRAPYVARETLRYFLADDTAKHRVQARR